MSSKVEHNAAATPARTRREVDVVVVGAGFSGLAAADRLVQRGLDVLVLEGRERVGGRSRTGEVAGVAVDFGATWLAPAHTAIREVVDRFGCGIAPQYHQGDNVLDLGGRRQTYRSTVPPVSPLVMVDMARVQWQLGRMARRLRLEHMWETPEAAAWDQLRFGEWLRRQHALSPTRSLMEVLTKVQFGTVPDEVSLLQVLRFVRSAGGIDTMLDVEGGYQQDRVAVTTNEVAVRFAESLGERVILGAPVRRIAYDPMSDGVGAGGVVVYTDDLEVSARSTIVTTSPVHRASISFDPPLPELHRGANRSWRLGALSKAFVAYERPVWRERGLSGESVSEGGAVFITFDVSPGPDGPGVVMAFCDARRFDHLDPAQRRRRVVEEVGRLLGVEDETVLDYVDCSWGSDDFAPGGPNPALAPGAWTSYGKALREPVGPVSWAGSDLSDVHGGTLDGAVLSGQGVADRVAERLIRETATSAR